MSDSQSLETLAKLFSTRRYWLRKASGRIASINKPLPKSALEGHLKGTAGVGLCPIRPGDNTCRVAIIDMDSHKGEVAWADMQELAGRLMTAGEPRGVRFMAFRSGGGSGIHLYAAWEEPQDARSVRAHLSSIMLEVGLGEGTGGVFEAQAELFPKQDSVPEDGAGSMVILPYHRQSVQLDPLDLDPWDTALELVFSDPVPVVEAVERPVRDSEMAEVPLELVKEAVEAIPNTGEAELDYDSWFRAVTAIHAATGGSEAGLELAHELSMKSTKYDEAFLDERVWPYIKERPDGITVQTLFGMARPYGFQGDVVAALAEIVEEAPVLPAEAAAAQEVAQGRDQIAIGVALGLSMTESGMFRPVLDNLIRVIEHPQWHNIEIGFDDFDNTIKMRHRGEADWRSVQDHDLVNLRHALEVANFGEIGREKIRDAILAVAQRNHFDSGITWLTEVVPAWDGTPRVVDFYHRYLGADDTPYAKALGLYMWTAMAGRCLTPGLKVDMVPVWVGEQGVGKTLAVSSLVPEGMFFEINLHENEDNISRKMVGKLVAELAELKGMRNREAQWVKAFLTRLEERWIPKYREFEQTYKRRTVFIGTTNDDDFLDDPTGNRRWLPINVGWVEVDAIKADLMQLWAEARELYRKQGLLWQGVSDLAEPERSAFVYEDSWAPIIHDYIHKPDPDDRTKTPRIDREEMVTVNDILREALQIDAGDVKKPHEMRVAGILKSFGLVKIRKQVGGKQEMRWGKPTKVRVKRPDCAPLAHQA